METGSILDFKRSGRPSIDKETVDVVHVAFHHAGFHKIFTPPLNAVSVRRVLFKLISKFTLYCS